MKHLAEGNVTGAGGADDELATNWFEVVSRKHMDELGLLIKAASKVLLPPPRNNSGAQTRLGSVGKSDKFRFSSA